MNPHVQIIQHDWTSMTDIDCPKADLVLADPPYNQGVEYADDPTGDRLTDDQYRSVCERTLACLPLAPNGTVWWITPERHADWIGPMLEEYVGPRLYRIIWQESFSQYQGSRGLTMDYRMIFVHAPHGADPAWNPDAIRIPSVRQQMGDKRANPKGRVPSCVWNIRRLQGTSKARLGWHPTQLPPELLDRIILGWSNPGDTVLDAFAGSGASGQRAVALGRNYVGVDRSPTYCEKMRQLLSASLEERWYYDPHRDEFMCRHGVGHPRDRGIHGCDGCCSRRDFPGTNHIGRGIDRDTALSKYGPQADE